ncbi:MAG TPA: acyl-CoA dehydrogenase family protein, partial [Mycobacteriales bacterium]|nr:acyl-CoA dehydrogenase family protein [Mycobacteriales bacterium]
MDLRFSAEDEAFRDEVRTWFAESLVGEFAELGDAGGPGREHEGVEVRRAWERVLGEADWSCIGWPQPYGRGATLMQQVIFAEEYAAAGAPHRINHFGENLLGPTLIECGSEAQKQRFLPKIKLGEELWCQGYSEPGAGSDLAGVKTKAVRDGDEWVITGQKVWTSLAHIADWCFVVTRTDPDSTRH